jgi:predicted NAD-dependent protein-ADP-ribosyltransferase YbiA (DUF1768 family)
MKKAAQVDANAAAANAVNAAEIRFYRSNEKPYGVFSNLHRTPVTFEGEVFLTTQ